MTTSITPVDYDNLYGYIDSLLVRHSAFTNAAKRLEWAFRAAPNLKDPFGLYIYGEARTGKSRLIEETVGKHASYRTEKGLIVLVVRLQVPAKPTIKSLAIEILKALGDPMPEKGTENSMTERLVVLLKACETRLLILDEFQHFVDKSSKYSVIHHVADWLKNLLNSTKVTAVLVGLEYGQAVLSQNEQLRGRFANPIRMPRFDWRDEKLRNEFLGLLDGFSTLMSEKFDVPELGSDEMGYRFYIATGGLTGYIFNLLRMAAWEAIGSGHTTISMHELQIAYEAGINHEDQYRINPFSKEFDLNDAEAFEHARMIGRHVDHYQDRSPKKGYKPRNTREALTT